MRRFFRQWEIRQTNIMGGWDVLYVVPYKWMTWLLVPLLQQDLERQGAVGLRVFVARSDDDG